MSVALAARFLLRATAPGLLAAAAALSFYRLWTPHHLRAVTGREGNEVRPCWACHHSHEPPRRAGGDHRSRHITPAGLAVSPDGRRLYVAAAGADRLLEVDLARGLVSRSLAVPGRPRGVAVSPDGRRLAVTSRDGDAVHLVDADSLQRLAVLPAGSEPFGVAVDPATGRIFSANGSSDDVAVIDPPAGPAAARSTRLTAGHQPYALATSRNGGLLAVANRLAFPDGPDAVPASEITLVDTTAPRVTDRRPLRSAHLSEGVAVSADGSFVLASAIRVRNLLPITEVERGSVMSSVLVLAETRPGGRTVQFPLDEVNACYADPSGVVLGPDDATAWVATTGARSVTLVDVAAMRAFVATASPAELGEIEDDLAAHRRYVLARIPTADGPRALALAPDGVRLYVAESLNDSVALIDTRERRLVGRIDLGGPRRPDRLRRGERVFHDASVTFQGQFSCRSCHPDGGSDGLSYDFVIDGVGRNRVENRSLLGLKGTAPFKWNGKNPDLATQCGPRFAMVLTRSDPFPPDRLADLVAYIESLPYPPRRANVAPADAVARGRAIFERRRNRSGEPIPVGQRCPTCHRDPLFTDRLMADVGSAGPRDSSPHFDTPHLIDVGATAPYLHDGRARTLEEIWTVHNPNDTHGVTNDLTKPELNDLVAYLRSL